MIRRSGDKLIQGRLHGFVRGSLYLLLLHHFEVRDPDVIVVEDMKHLLGPGERLRAEVERLKKPG